jgi:hypothetical protein
MSSQADATLIELHLFSRLKTDSLIEQLTAIAHFHVTGDYLDIGHTVNFGRPWVQNSACDSGLLSPPYLDGPNLEWLELPRRRIRCLWLIPITPAERNYKKKHGLDALETKFEEAKFDYLDPLRRSVV